MSEGMGCWKVGCIGCAALVLLPLGFLLVVAGLQLAQGERTPEVERVATAQPLPGETPAERPTDETSGIPIASHELGSDLTVVAGESGTIEVSFSMGDLRILPAKAGSSIRVEGEYDRSSFELEEVFEEGAGGAWTYGLTFDAKGGFLGMLARGGVEAGDNEITLYIPPGHPFRLVGNLGLGEADVDLGGLAVRGVDLEIGMGDHRIEFREPTAEPVESFVIESSLGGLELLELGNASPAHVDIEHSMGDLEVDLDGDWQRDAEVMVHLGLGGSRIRAPRRARLEVAKSSVGLGEVRRDWDDSSMLAENAPVVRLEVTGSLGELVID